MRPLRVCDVSNGRGVVRCHVCDGKGVIRKTGNRKRNSLNVSRVVGSRWTSVEIRSGHRHYVCSEIKGSKKKKNLELRMSNSCGPEEKRVHLWITENEIRNKMEWRMGWVTLVSYMSWSSMVRNVVPHLFTPEKEEIQKADKGPLLDIKECFLCKGQRIIKCAECNGKGKIGYNQPLYD